MWCRRIRTQLSAYADGELTTAEARRVQEHLAHCERCAHEHKSIRQVSRLTALVPEEELPAGLHARIMARLAYAETAPTPATARRRAVPYGPWLCAAFGSATAALALGFVQSRAAVPVRRSPASPSAAQVRPALEDPGSPETSPTPAETAPDRSKVAVSPPAPAPQNGAAPAETRERSAQAPAAPEPADSAAKPQPAMAKKAPPAAGNVRPIPRSEVPKLAREPRPEPAPPGARPMTPAPEERTPEPTPPGAVSPRIMAMPGEPVVNTTGSMGQPEPVMAGMEKEPGMMMAGASPKMEAPEVEDEGLRMLRTFLEERNRSVPQPPTVDPNRRTRRSL